VNRKLRLGPPSRRYSESVREQAAWQAERGGYGMTGWLTAQAFASELRKENLGNLWMKRGR